MTTGQTLTWVPFGTRIHLLTSSSSSSRSPSSSESLSSWGSRSRSFLLPECCREDASPVSAFVLLPSSPHGHRDQSKCYSLIHSLLYYLLFYDSFVQSFQRANTLFNEVILQCHYKAHLVNCTASALSQEEWNV